MKKVRVSNACEVTTLSRTGEPHTVMTVSAKTEFEFSIVVTENPSYVVYANKDAYYIFPADAVKVTGTADEPSGGWVETPDSSQIERFKYQPLDESLDVQFKNGGLYRYSGVPADVYEGMRKAESVGKFLNKSVKGTYGFEKLS